MPQQIKKKGSNLVVCGSFILMKMASGPLANTVSSIARYLIPVEYTVLESTYLVTIALYPSIEPLIYSLLFNAAFETAKETPEYLPKAISALESTWTLTTDLLKNKKLQCEKYLHQRYINDGEDHYWELGKTLESLGEYEAAITTYKKVPKPENASVETPKTKKERQKELRYQSAQKQLRQCRLSLAKELMLNCDSLQKYQQIETLISEADNINTEKNSHPDIKIHQALFKILRDYQPEMKGGFEHLLDMLEHYEKILKSDEANQREKNIAKNTINKLIFPVLGETIKKLTQNISDTKFDEMKKIEELFTSKTDEFENKGYQTETISELDELIRRISKIGPKEKTLHSSCTIA